VILRERQLTVRCSRWSLVAN